MKEKNKQNKLYCQLLAQILQCFSCRSEIEKEKRIEKRRNTKRVNRNKKIINAIKKNLKK